MSRRCALGLDLGTSGLKAVLVGEDGSVIAHAAEPYDVVSLHPGWAETDPHVWEQAARAAVVALVAQAPDAEVVGIGVDGQMHGAVLIDDRAEPVRPAVLWPDSRAVSELPRWRALDDRTLSGLANPLSPGMAGPILGWLTTHEPDIVRRAHRLMAPKDWLRSRLVSRSLVTDPSDASATLLWSVAADDWDRDLCRAVGVDAELLATLAPSADVAGTLGGNAAAWGLAGDPPVSVGCADAAATILGTPARSKRHTLTVGTGAQVVMPDVAPSVAGPIRYHTYRQAGPSYFAMAALMNAGLALSRVVHLLNASWDDLYRSYDQSRPLPGFLPYLSGERLPTALDGSAAGWFDIGLETERSDLLASALEGVAFAIRRAMEPFPDAVEETIDLTGGGSRHPVFAQLVADVLGRPLRRIDRQDATALGAAWLGWRVAGCAEPVRSETTGVVIEPSASERSADALALRYQRFLVHSSQIEASS